MQGRKNVCNQLSPAEPSYHRIYNPAITRSPVLQLFSHHKHLLTVFDKVLQVQKAEPIWLSSKQYNSGFVHFISGNFYSVRATTQMF